MGRTQKEQNGAKEEEARMNEQRAREITRREEAQAHAGQIVAGSGERGKPRRMPRMVSVRLDGELLRQLRIVAQQRNTTVSNLLREGAELIIEDTYASAQPRTSFTVSGAKEWLPTTTERELAAH
jgi:uncharacterized protein (DUF4415 family)